ncbi:DUF5681 domain-containing protein [Pseudorhodoplanes sinuspersici]|uniref:Uncharacterized protein n=1 Tax=Pseudorhodoplanes sinuspersici TaxID=1235591 RepID=A0A1W6ZYE4_9HYPH|nr:DUF5681 domain-containing protein [Pseudorhodoplanes sinuspersici]ARQ02346.1 hypothetical protein CAK95_27000 [Pseudorhodoplanes sinuspersici]RKE74173.1 hypothetical protein DFP91_2076 [Pseudorhodoplanes sinuspersici]
MSKIARADYNTRFKKGQSGNPNGRPKGRRNNEFLLREILFKEVRVTENGRVRTLPKIAAAAEVCLNNALKGNFKSFCKMLEIAEKYGLLEKPSMIPQVLQIQRTFVDPRHPELNGPIEEYFKKKEKLQSEGE